MTVNNSSFELMGTVGSIGGMSLQGLGGYGEAESDEREDEGLGDTTGKDCLCEWCECVPS